MSLQCNLEIVNVKEPAQITNPEYSVDKIVARMEEAAARKGQFENFPSPDVATSAEFRPARRNGQPLGEVDIQPFTLQPAFYPHTDGRYHVNDLLKYHDRSFIQNAYRAILKRGPDASGYKTFIESLRSARLNKIDILAGLRYSAEGRAKKIEIEGLRTPALIRKAYRVPVLGYLLNLAVALARLPLMVRGEQQFAAHVLAQQELVADHLNHLGRTLRAHSAEVSQVIERQNQSIKQLGDRLPEQVQEQLRQIDEHHSRLSEETRRQNEALETRLGDQTKAVAAQFAEFASVIDLRLTETQSGFTARLSQEMGRGEQEVRAIREQLAKWEEGLKTFQVRALQWRAEISATETELRQTDAIQREQIELTVRNLTHEIDRIFEKQQTVTAELVLQEQRVATLLAEARLRLPAPFAEDQLRIIAGESEHRLDAFYAAFDEEFRGSREEIKQRLKVYLPIIADQGIGGPAMPILDVGCGRGEWLELLMEEHLECSGVDLNRVLAQQCRTRGLTVAEEDLLRYLRSQPDRSVGAVTGFHIIEHLPLEMLIDFLNETVRILKPGGGVIFETPNPQNVLVGSCNFYFDPTHRNPVPSQVLAFLLESRGFVGVEILKLNPSADTPVADESDLARRFNHYFYGPMDYAAIGWKA